MTYDGRGTHPSGYRSMASTICRQPGHFTSIDNTAQRPIIIGIYPPGETMPKNIPTPIPEPPSSSSLLVPEKGQFQHILRVLNTNVEGKTKIMFAMTNIKGVGRRYANLVCKKADIDLKKRAGELTNEELERLVTIMQNPTQYKVPQWFLNRQKNFVDGKYTQLLANGLDNQMREDLERLKKIRAHRGLRHYWGVRVRGQHTKTTGRRGRVVGVSKKK